MKYRSDRTISSRLWVIECIRSLAPLSPMLAATVEAGPPTQVHRAAEPLPQCPADNSRAGHSGFAPAQAPQCLD